MTELERALADIAEVRDRLAGAQRFKGYSALTAIASGAFAIVTGILQAVLVGTPLSFHAGRLYFALWFVCAALSIALNYGAIAHWFVSDESARHRWQTRTVGLSILPAIILGAALSFAALRFEAIALLPGMWCACYGVGLFASRLVIPRGVMAVSIAFLLAGIALLFAPDTVALQWWVMAGLFGGGQIAIGILIARDAQTP